MGASAEAMGQGAGTGGGRFAPFHAADAWWFPAILALVWVGLLGGFVPEMIRHVTQHPYTFLPIVHVHAVFFVGWMLLLTAQLVLVRRGQVALHRRLGRLALFWAPAVLVLGLVTSVMVDRSTLGTPRWDPAFLSIQLADLLDFGVVVAAALLLRRDGASHRRLMILSAVALGNAGFGRWFGAAMAARFGQGFAGTLAGDYATDLLIVAALLLYDTITRGRPHRALLLGGSLIVGVEMLAEWLYHDPAWIGFTDHLLRS